MRKENIRNLNRTVPWEKFIARMRPLTVLTANGREEKVTALRETPHYRTSGKSNNGAKGWERREPQGKLGGRRKFKNIWGGRPLRFAILRGESLNLYKQKKEKKQEPLRRMPTMSVRSGE